REVAPDQEMRDVDNRRAVALERRDLKDRWIRVRIDLPERRLGLQPLRVLLVAVEDERRAGEALPHQLAQVADRRRVAEREAELRLEPLRLGERGGAARVAEVIGDWLLAKDVLPGLERRPGELEMGVARRADVHEVDVVAADEVAVVGKHVGNIEALRRLP